MSRPVKLIVSKVKSDTLLSALARSHFFSSQTFSVLDLGGALFLVKSSKNNTPSF